LAREGIQYVDLSLVGHPEDCATVGRGEGIPSFSSTTSGEKKHPDESKRRTDETKRRTDETKRRTDKTKRRTGETQRHTSDRPDPTPREHRIAFHSANISTVRFECMRP
jgi:hypothetical protein